MWTKREVRIFLKTPAQKCISIHFHFQDAVAMTVHKMKITQKESKHF